MGNFSEEITKTVSDIISFLRGEKADENLILQTSQKTALYQIRDALIKDELRLSRGELKLFADVIDTLPVGYNRVIARPPVDKAVCITHYSISSEYECEVAIRHGFVYPAWNNGAGFMFAEKGGVAISFAKDREWVFPVGHIVWLDYRAHPANGKVMVSFQYFLISLERDVL